MRCKPSSLLVASAVLLWVLVSCALGRPQDWSAKLGPVVPHDSFPADCSLCHETGSWTAIRSDFRFDHAEATGVALVGAHEKAQCLRCHNDRGPVARFAVRGCAGCHEDVHQGRLGQDCTTCHSESSQTWLPKEFVRDHARTRFPLVGAHAGVACYRCHAGADVGNFKYADVRCESCHQAALAQAKEPDHVQQGWTRDCARCHRPTGWSGGNFTHSRWPLTGAHSAADCSACHTGGVFVGTPRDCVACHRTEYDATSEPRHVQAGFSTACETCHNTRSWAGARFAHSSWPLEGQHLGASCSACHQNGVYRGTGRNCVDCHRADYDRTQNPNHAASSFPLDCAQCHSPRAWQGARFEHRFPISSGDHSGLSCTDCHKQPANYAVFSCIDCHEHRRSEMDDEHRDVSGYAWESSRCLQCHPNGR